MSTTSAGDTLGDAYINVLADTSKLGEGLNRAASITTNYVSGIATKMAGLLGVSLSIAGAFRGMNSAIAKGGALYDLSQQTNVAVKDLVILQQAFENAGASAGMVPRTIMQMQKALANSKMSETWKKIGLDIKGTGEAGPAQQFEMIGKALNNIKDPAERTAVAMKVFGRGGYMLKGLFADPNAMRDATTGLGSMPYVMARSAEMFDKFGDAMSMAKAKMTGFWAGILLGMKPALDAATKFMASFDFAKAGVKIGAFIRVLQLAFTEGKLGDLVFLGLQIGFIKALNIMINGVVFLGKTIKDVLIASFNILTNLDFWSGIADIALGALSAIGSGLIEIFNKPVAYLTAVFDKLFDDMFVKLAQAKQGFRILGMSRKDRDALIALEYSDKSKEDIAKEKARMGIFDITEDKRSIEQRYQERLTGDKPWLTKQGEAASELSGAYTLGGVGKVTGAIAGPMENMLVKIYENFTTAMDEKGMFSTTVQEKQFKDLFDPLWARAVKEIGGTGEAAGKKGKTAVEASSDKGGFISFSEAVKTAQKDAMKQLVEENKKGNIILGEIRDKIGGGSIFGEGN